MGKSKYSKYITTELKRGIVMPGYKGDQHIEQGYRDGYRLGLEHPVLKNPMSWTTPPPDTWRGFFNAEIEALLNPDSV